MSSRVIIYKPSQVPINSLTFVPNESLGTNNAQVYLKPKRDNQKMQTNYIFTINTYTHIHTDFNLCC